MEGFVVVVDRVESVLFSEQQFTNVVVILYVRLMLF